MLTAKEWLKQGFAPIKTLIADEDGTIQQKHFEECMEQYANYINKELEDKIIQFREFLTNEITLKASTNLHSLNVVDYYKKLIEERDKTYLKEYDEHFNLK